MTLLAARIASVRSGSYRNTGTGVMGPVRQRCWVRRTELVVGMVRTWSFFGMAI